MPQKLRIPSVLRQFTNQEAVIELSAKTVGEGLATLQARFPEIKDQLFDDNGALHRFVNLYVNQDDIRSLQNLTTPLKDGDEITLIPAIAGG